MSLRSEAEDLAVPWRDTSVSLHSEAEGAGAPSLQRTAVTILHSEGKAGEGKS